MIYLNNFGMFSLPGQTKFYEKYEKFIVEVRLSSVPKIYQISSTPIKKLHQHLKKINLPFSQVFRLIFIYFLHFTKKATKYLLGHHKNILNLQQCGKSITSNSITSVVTYSI